MFTEKSECSAPVRLRIHLWHYLHSDLATTRQPAFGKTIGSCWYCTWQFGARRKFHAGRNFTSGYFDAGRKVAFLQFDRFARMFIARYARSRHTWNRGLCHRPCPYQAGKKNDGRRENRKTAWAEGK